MSNSIKEALRFSVSIKQPKIRKQALQRAEYLYATPPCFTPRLLSYGIAPEDTVLLTVEKLHLIPFQSFSLDLLRKASEFLPTIEQTWKQRGFIHGDISAQNLYWDLNREIFGLLGWKLCLPQTHGTPEFSPWQTLLFCRHSLELQEKSFQKLSRFLKITTCDHVPKSIFPGS